MNFMAVLLPLRAYNAHFSVDCGKIVPFISTNLRCTK